MLNWQRLRIYAPIVAVVSFGVYVAAAGLTRSGAITADSWYALVAGRVIWEHGLPHHDHLALMSYDDRWTDQQWLAQLTYYSLDRLGGLHLVVALHLLLYSAGVALAVAAGYKGSYSVGRTALAAIIPVLVLRGWWAIPRSQDFSVLLFGLFLYLIARDRKEQDWTILVTLPLLAVWANLHGVCLLGAALLVLYGACLIHNGRRIGLLLLAAPLCLLASPYSPSELVSYYHQTIFNAALQAHVSEWRPPRLQSDPFVFLTGAAVVFVAVKYRRRLSFFSLTILIGSLLGALLAQRNIHWYALIAAATLPAALPVYAFPQRLRLFGRKAADLSLALAVVAAAFVATAIAKPAVKMPDRLANEINHGPVFAGGIYADWLLWNRPDLSGHVAFDIRWELLPQSAINQLAAVTNGAKGSQKFINKHRWVLLDRADNPTLVQLVAADRRFKLVDQQGSVQLYKQTAAK